MFKALYICEKNLPDKCGADIAWHIMLYPDDIEHIQRYIKDNPYRIGEVLEQCRIGLQVTRIATGATMLLCHSDKRTRESLRSLKEFIQWLEALQKEVQSCVK